jgi:hypothetical protein
MLRAHTPLPKRPAKEAELLDEVLAVFQPADRRRPPVLTSRQVVAAVRSRRPEALPIDIRLVLCPPYFQLTDRGWICKWLLR